MGETATPLMAQYQSIKEQHPGEVLFFRLGDFYEMFNEDAVEVSRLLNLTLTQRQGRPMCGVPFHAAKVYIARLLRAGKKIALCEQIGDPRGKGLTDRKVLEVITPGTAVEEEYLDKSSHNYLASLYASGGKTAFAYIDVTTAEFFATSWDTAAQGEALARCLGLAAPRELLLPESLAAEEATARVLSQQGALFVSTYPDWHFSPEGAYKKLCAVLGTANLKSFSLEPDSPEVPPAAFLLTYLEKTAALPTGHIRTLRVFHDSDFVVIDDSSWRNLEVEANLQDGSRAFTLYDSVCYTKTAMGSRLLSQWLLFPLKNPQAIRSRQDRVTRFAANRRGLDKARGILGGILDMERLSSRISMDKAHPKDLQALRGSLLAWKELRALTDGEDFSGIDTAPCMEAADLIGRALLDSPSVSLTEGGIIREGWSDTLDRYRKIQTNFNAVLEDYAESERRATGIGNLKIRYNRLSGYYIEISRGKTGSVPRHFILKRTLVNGDRYTTHKLSGLEEELLNAGQNIVDEEKRLFLDLRESLKKFIPLFQSAARETAYIDVTASFAFCALSNRWVCPVVDDSSAFSIVAGRHPVVEKHLPAREFVPNDAFLENGKTFALVTGPNMAGKSTYLRQNALIVLLAQTGSFVPAKEARLGAVDRIFCRVGASDNLARGESTFLVEMTETARILRSATEKSLVIMDEVGRGTSTEDGLSIAWAVSEYLLGAIRCKTFFATHYHELTRLSHPALRLLCMEVLETEGHIVFLKKVKEGAVTNSYGIHVARLAGIPRTVLDRAEVILRGMEAEAGERRQLPEGEEPPEPDAPPPAVPFLFSDEELILDEILSAAPETMTPLEALTLVTRWKKTLSGR
ncbi:MAG: DNA mismatch repair protein MutS [Spirochaetaceae bacterium]|jgi:DNA mismatch repair protein MutS|nr:DNA mismatch repair protein MutS [Spirochaetaceae bacterium]